MTALTLPGGFGLFWLVLARTGGVFAAAPLLSTQDAPMPLRAALSFLVALAVMPAATPPPGGVPQALLPYALIAVHEVVVGLTIGFLARLVFFAAELAGGLIDVQLGLTIGSTVDPIYGQPISVFGSWLNTLATLAFLAAGGLEVLVAAVGVSYAHLPLGGATLLAAGARTAVDALGWAFLTALALAAPVLAVGFLLNLLLGVLGKAMPQLGLLQTVLPAQVGVGLVALLLTLPLLVAGFSGLVPHTVTWIGRLWP